MTHTEALAYEVCARVAARHGTQPPIPENPFVEVFDFETVEAAVEWFLEWAGSAP